MAQEQNPLGELVFLSADVARIAGITLRQLQWWDERKLVSPRKEEHRRIYTPEQVLEILTVASFRHKGLSLQKIRKILRLLRRELAWPLKSRLYLLTDGNSIYVENQPESVLQHLIEATRPMHVVCLTDQMDRITSDNRPHRYRTRQLPLFESRKPDGRVRKKARRLRAGLTSSSSR